VARQVVGRELVNEYAQYERLRCDMKSNKSLLKRIFREIIIYIVIVLILFIAAGIVFSIIFRGKKVHYNKSMTIEQLIKDNGTPKYIYLRTPEKEPSMAALSSDLNIEVVIIVEYFTGEGFWDGLVDSNNKLNSVIIGTAQGIKPDPDFESTDGCPEWVVAIAADDGDTLENIISETGKSQMIYQYGWTPLHFAVHLKRGKILELFLSKGFDADAKSVMGWTPLHGATAAGWIEGVEKLLAAGVEVNVKTDKGVTPLDCANAKDMQQLLRSHDAKTGKELQ